MLDVHRSSSNSSNKNANFDTTTATHQQVQPANNNNNSNSNSNSNRNRNMSVNMQDNTSADATTSAKEAKVGNPASGADAASSSSCSGMPLQAGTGTRTGVAAGSQHPPSATTATTTAPYDPMALQVHARATSQAQPQPQPQPPQVHPQEHGQVLPPQSKQPHSNNTNPSTISTETIAPTFGTNVFTNNTNTRGHYASSNPFGSQLRPPTFHPGMSQQPTTTSNINTNTTTLHPAITSSSPSSSSTLPPPTRETVLKRLSEALLRRSLAKIDLCQKGLTAADAKLVKMALLQNRQLRVLKLGYNQLGDDGIRTLVAGISQHTQLQSLDLGFNNISDIGCQALASAIVATPTSQLSTLYLAGNCIGADGAMALADVIRRNGGSALRRLYMTGNRLGPDGVKGLTEAILEEAASRHSNIKINSIQNDEVMVQKAAVNTNDNTISNNTDTDMDISSTPAASSNHSMQPASPTSSIASSASSTTQGMQELFLGGTALGAAGCQAVARLLGSRDCRIKVLSLANCEITDDEISRQDFGLASCIKENRDCLQLTSLQLSFNNITHRGLEALMNALWGSKTLKELRLDNNNIGDRGAQHLAAILPYLTTLDTLDVGFNDINNKSQGMKILMKAVAETNNLATLSLSGNPMQDVTSAKAVAYALAYNTSLQSLLLVHCHLTKEGHRHVAAGAVSNSRTSLRELSGFPIGPVIVTLGFPDALEHWTNEQVLNFIHLMWNKTKAESSSNKEEGENQELDPLKFLPSSLDAKRRSGPLENTIVVDVAREAFASLVANGVDVFSRRPGYPSGKGSPVVLAPRGAIMLESVDGDSIVESMGEVTVSSDRTPSSINMVDMSVHNIGSVGESGSIADASLSESLTNGFTAGKKKQARSFVAPPQEKEAAKHSQGPDPSRKKRIVEWLCSNIKHLNKMSQMPFDSGELLRLHQHYFTPVVNESGGSGGFRQDGTSSSYGFSSVPNVSRDNSSVHHLVDSSSPSFFSSTGLQSGDVNMMVPTSVPMFANGGNGQQYSHQHPPSNGSSQGGGQQGTLTSSLPMLKRKVSYRFLGDASMHHHPTLPPAVASICSSEKGASFTGSLWSGGYAPGSVSKMIQNGPVSGYHSLPPKSKKARRNRTRISFLPRIKAKLDSYLDVCHEKALATMRQLYYVEQAILSGQVNPLDESSRGLQHLCGALATDAETIVVDMI